MMAMLGLEIDLAQRLQLSGQLAQFAGSFDRDRRGGSGDGDNLALQMMPAQQAEQIIQKAQRAHMARRAHVEDRDVPLERDGAEGRGALCGDGADDGAASVGLCELSTATGMSCSTAGSRVAGCRTLAPKQASSVASWKLISAMRCALGQMRGSVVRMPLTSVQISMRSAASAAPMMAAE